MIQFLVYPGIAGRIPTVGRPRGRPPLHHSLSTRGRLQSKIGTGVRGGGNAGTRHSSPRGQNQIPLQKIASASASLSMPQLTPKPRVQYPPTLPPQTLHHTDVFDAHVQNNTTRTPDSDEPPTLTEEVITCTENCITCQYTSLVAMQNARFTTKIYFLLYRCLHKIL